ncbi:MAG: toll/interleukin-1 receptor domain-containing protein [Nostoc sp. DedSLP03]|uniref:toll/interleukin-1 receptor domain-containing protein n=1 Tax=Nostoc sp. DedSLP03 TaxID=3075400 RepID=UPI002AD51E7D|nr:toll/interleukin-1 receptor domain-containing protein [Nostoc sp. DedSLP03]MDZ7966417.1 toll/interleukin-1 receptor domain-containing protein [Nostoc sp. DedSLP03]
MPFEYSCFISFRHSKHKLLQKFVENIYDHLSTFLSVYKKNVFLDRESLKNGDLLNESIAFNLCHSAFMVMIYTPDYLDENHTWCAREYKAMLRLEQERLKLWTSNYDRNHGLIIPIIYSQYGPLLSELKERLFIDFSKLMMTKPKYAQTKSFHQELFNLAETINERCDKLNYLGDLCKDCDNFTLPEENEIKLWIKSKSLQSKKQPLPRQ